jgi:AAA15 family ATPase/GTPase
MKIKKITIDGFRNIKNTTLDFDSNPIIVLLAPNNRGKTNLLEGIQSGFELISKQGTQVADYIEDADNYANWNISRGDEGEFEFVVEFERGVDKEDKKEVTYRYNYSLGYFVDKNSSEKKVIALGIIKESLTKCTIENPEGMPLFTRIPKSALSEKGYTEDIIKLNDGTEYIIPRIKRINDNWYESSSYLGLHKVGGMPISRKNGKKEANNTLKEISGVLTSLTREDIGKIIMREDKSSDFSKSINDLDALVEDVGKMKPNELNFFKEEFQELFPYYKPRIDENCKKIEGIIVEPLGTSGRHQVLFNDERKKRQETASSLSFGTRRIFKMLSQVISNKTPLFSVEGIENGLHHQLYFDLVSSLFNAVDSGDKERSYKKIVGENRPHEPRLIITSHAPTIVNAFVEMDDNKLGSIYIVIPDLKNNGATRFVGLNEGGKKEIKRLRANTVFGAGDFIFRFFSDKGFNPINLHLLDITQEEINELTNGGE